MAVVGDLLVSLDAQETQEAQLDHPQWLAVRVHIGELGGSKGETQGENKTLVVLTKSHNRWVTDLTASGELTVPGSWSLIVPGAHLHLPQEMSTSHIS